MSPFEVQVELQVNDDDDWLQSRYHTSKQNKRLPKRCDDTSGKKVQSFSKADSLTKAKSCTAASSNRVKVNVRVRVN